MRFGIVGGLATLVHAAIYLGVISLSGLTAQLANLVGFTGAFSVSLVGHHGYTFREYAGRSFLASGWRLLVTALFGYVCNAGFVYFVTDIMQADERFAMIFMVGVTPVVVFYLSKLWAFKGRSVRLPE